MLDETKRPHGTYKEPGVMLCTTIYIIRSTTRKQDVNLVRYSLLQVRQELADDNLKSTIEIQYDPNTKSPTAEFTRYFPTYFHTHVKHVARINRHVLYLVSQTFETSVVSSTKSNMAIKTCTENTPLRPKLTSNNSENNNCQEAG